MGKGKQKRETKRGDEPPNGKIEADNPWIYGPPSKAARGRQDTIRLKLWQFEITIHVEGGRRSGWFVLDSLRPDYTWRGKRMVEDYVNACSELYLRNPALFLYFALHIMTNQSRPHSKLSEKRMARLCGMILSPQDVKRYIFKHIAAFLFDFLSDLRHSGIWETENAPSYLEQFWDDLRKKVGRRKREFQPWGAGAVRECMKLIDKDRVYKIRESSFGRKYCYGKCKDIAIWEHPIPDSVGQVSLIEIFKTVKASDNLKRTSASLYFLSLFFFALRFSKEAMELGNTNQDVGDMVKRVQEWQRRTPNDNYAPMGVLLEEIGVIR